MPIDLHCHTTCSDGTLTPHALVERAHQNGVTLLSITDHDTVQAYDILRGMPIPEGLSLVPGIELSTQYSNRGIHVLGLGIDPDHPSIREGVRVQSQFRIDRAEKIAAKLEKCGISNALSGAQKFSAGGNIGRPHFAQFLVDSDHCKSTDDAFKRYLSEHKPAYVKQVWSSLEDIISWINDAGGKAILAHPTKYKMTRSKLIRLLKQIKAYGGHGLEVLSARQAPHVTADLAKIAIELDMLVSIGSDFHSPTQTWLRLGMHEYAPSGCKTVWDNL